MSKLARVLALGALLAAANLASMTTVAHATDHAAIVQDSQRPPTERQVGEAWRHPQVATEQTTIADNTLRPPTEAQVGEAWRHPTTAPGPPAPVPAKPSRQPGWLIVSLAVLVTALAVSGGLAVLAAKRTRRRARVGHAA